MNYLETETGAALLERFLATVGTSSRRVYKSEVSQFFKGFEGDPAAINQDDLHAWRERLGPGTAEKTLKRKTSILNRFFKFMAGETAGFQNPFGDERGSLKEFNAGDYPDSDAFRRDLAEWMRAAPGINSESTRKLYANHLSLFFRWADKPPGNVRPEDLEDYRDHLRAAGRKPSTVWTRFIALNGFFKHLAGKDARFVSPLDFAALKLDVPDPERGYYNILTLKESKRLLNAPDRRTLIGKRDYLAIRLMLIYGLRVGEVAKLRWGDAEKERHKGKLRLWIRDRKGRKGRRENTPIILEGAELRAWDDWTKSSGIHWDPETPVIAPFRWDHTAGGLAIDYERLRTNAPRSTTALRNAVAKRMKAAGIETEARNLSPHALRHTCFTHLFRAGANIVDVKKLAAHKNISTTMIYAHAAQSFDDHVGMKNPLAKL